MRSPDPRHHAFSRTTVFLAAAFGAFLAAFVTMRIVVAFTGPTQAPPSGTGMISVSGNKVGIGTTTPAYTLDVAGQIRSSSGGFVFPDGSTQTTAGGGANQTVSSGNVSAGTFGSNTGGGNYEFPSNVGIGTTPPAAALDIAAGANSDILLGKDANDSRFNIISLNGNLTEAGYVGIAGGAAGDNGLDDQRPPPAQAILRPTKGTVGQPENSWIGSMRWWA